MKDEVKEILQEVIDDIYQSGEYTYQAKDLEKVLDYITNLQEENEKNKEYSEFYKDMSDKWENMSVVLKKSCEEYKSRNEKAIENIDLVIELIKQQPTEDDTWILNKLNGFKYLLQGEDKE